MTGYYKVGEKKEKEKQKKKNKTEKPMKTHNLQGNGSQIPCDLSGMNCLRSLNPKRDPDILNLGSRDQKHLETADSVSSN